MVDVAIKPAHSAVLVLMVAWIRFLWRLLNVVTLVKKETKRKKTREKLNNNHLFELDFSNEIVHLYPFYWQTILLRYRSMFSIII